MNLYLDLFLTFARIGVCTFGGGYAMLPILQREVVEDKGWVEESDLTDYYAIGQCTPGIIAVNVATFVGCKQGGHLAAVAATLGLIFPSVVIIVLIAAFLQNFAHLAVVEHAFAGVRACVCALIASSVIKLRKSTVVDTPTKIFFWVVLLLSALSGPITTLVPALSIVLSPVVLVVLAGVCSLLLRRKVGDEG